MNDTLSPVVPLARLVALSRRAKQSIMVALDVMVALGTMWLSFSLRYGIIFIPYTWQQLVIILLAPTLAIPIFVRLGLYRAIFRFGGVGAIAMIVRAVSLYTILFATALVVLSFPNVPRTVAIIQPMLFAWAVLAVRSFSGFLLTPGRPSRASRLQGEKLLIFGAGLSGVQTCLALQGSRDYDVVGFIDDMKDKIGGEIAGRTVYARADVQRLVETKGVSGVLLALPHASRQVRNEIIEWLRPFNLHVRSVPSVLDMTAGKVSLTDVRELEIEDILARPPASHDDQIAASYLGGQTVLVTGAGGSIGSELCRQILRAGPAKLILAEISEVALYAIDARLEELKQALDLDVEVIPLLCDVRNKSRIGAVFATWRPDVIYHAAAYKHVPLVEHNATEGVGNNVLGTFNVAQSALASGTKRFVLVSTDKAVRPTNVMGASKRMAEIVLQALAAEIAATSSQDAAHRTIFTMVRFGNVLGSSGSVVPLFRRQLAAGGPLTVTHTEVTRYFMTIPEAAGLVLEAGAMAHGGEVFLLHMGEPVKIIDLARRMIELSGYTVREADNPDGGIAISITGMRPGEKLYEELLIDDNALSTSNDRIMQARERMWPWSEVSQGIAKLEEAVASGDVTVMRQTLASYVDGFSDDGTIVDFLHLGQNSPRSTPMAIAPGQEF